MFTLPILALVLAAPATKSDPKDLKTAIVGEWTIEKFVFDGEGLEDERKGDEETGLFIFEADGKLTMKMPFGKKTQVEKGTYKLDVSKTPAVIVASPAKGEEEPDFTGIIKVSGDTLTICFGQKGRPLPKEFVSKEGSLALLFELKRVKKGK